VQALDFLPLAAPLALVLWSVRLERKVLEGWIRIASQTRREGARYVLRVRVAGPNRIDLGSSVESKSGDDSEFPSSSPELTSHEVKLVDDSDRTLILPKGTRLEVHRFEGAHRVMTEAITSSTGTKQRFSFEVDPDKPFWIRDAPSWLDCAQTSDPEVRTIPAREGGYRVDTTGPQKPVDPEIMVDRLRWPIVAAILLIALYLVPLSIERGTVKTIFWIGVALVTVRLVWRWFDVVDVPDDAGSSLLRSNDDPTAVSVTIGDLTIPLWAHGLESPERWLFGKKRAGDVHVAILALSDPEGSREKNPRDSVVGSASFHLSDHVWTRSDACATVGVPLIVGSARVNATERDKSFEALHPWLRNFKERVHVVWGQAKADLEHDGYALRMRSTEAPSAEKRVEGTLPMLSDRLLKALELESIVHVREPRKGFAPLTGPALDAYLVVCDLMLLLVLMSPNNQAVPRLDDEWQRGVVGLGEDLANLAKDSTIAQLVWITSAIYAHDAGGLDAAMRDKVLAFVRKRTDRDDALYELAPAIFYRLGEKEEAIRACDERLAQGATDEYRQWLTDVRASAS